VRGSSAEPTNDKGVYGGKGDERRGIREELRKGDLLKKRYEQVLRESQRKAGICYNI